MLVLSLDLAHPHNLFDQLGLLLGDKVFACQPIKLCRCLLHNMYMSDVYRYISVVLCVTCRYICLTCTDISLWRYV